MIRSMIIDDDPMASEALRYLLNKYPDIEIVECFSSAIDALAFLEKNQVDLLFLDIEMPDLSGLEFLETAHSLPAVILTTQNEKYAVKAFEYEVLDYLTKPVRYSGLTQALNR